MSDPLGVTKYSVYISPPSAGNRQKLLRRLDVMQKELQRMQRAVSQLKNALHHPASTKPVADGVLNSRNWVLSLMISHSFIQTMLDNDNPYYSVHCVQTRMMAAKAVQEGMDEARREHMKDLQHP